MSIHDALQDIMSTWTTARQEAFANHPTAAALRGAAAREVELSIHARRGLSIKGSAGAGQWAGVPWIAIFDDVVTDSATRGYYLVYLFSVDGSAVHLSLN